MRKDVVGYEGLYEVNEVGIIRSKNRFVKYKRGGVYMERKINGRVLDYSYVDGYSRVTLGKKPYLVHRIVYCTFNGLSLEFKGQKSKTIVMHKNDIKNDNRLENLMLGTQKDNVHDCIKKGRKKTGCIKRVKIGFDDIDNIKKDYIKLKSIYKVAPLYGVSYSIISRVINGKIWNIEKRINKE